MRAKAGRYFLYFLLYSILGWAYEVFLEVVVYRWGYSDRGVLLGPYCPIYGVGALLFLLCFRRLRAAPLPRPVRLLALFVGCMAVATAVELAATYLMEACTGSWPWQTYRDYRINFQGRIALSPALRFGLGGVVFLCVLQPLFEKLAGALSDRTVRRISAGLALVLAVDIAVTLAR